ncbi:MAG TPA: hypothetical protein VI457_09460 [Methylococcaceae bacterium]|nr:hypothetical protein [Methylococcaceae bacterium]
MSTVRLIDGGRDQLLDEASSALFRGICLGEKDQLERLSEIDAILSRRGNLRLVCSRTETAVLPSE